MRRDVPSARMGRGDRARLMGDEAPDAHADVAPGRPT